MIAIADMTGDPATLEGRLIDFLDTHARDAGHPFTGKTYGLEAWDGSVFLGGAQYQLTYGWCFLKLLAVTADQRQSGVGSRLLDALES